jgi:mono/diheme cytochrome c family protein
MAAVAAAVWLAGAGARVGADDSQSPARQEIPLNYEQSNGQKLFAHYCAVCHGVSGEGDGFNAFNLTPKPRDLSDRASMQHFSDQQLFQVISQGGAERGRSNLMPPWGHTLSERQIRYVVAYVRTLEKPK